MVKGHELQMLRLEGSWRRRLEIEAKECEHAERLAARQQFAQTRDTAANALAGIPTEPNRQPTIRKSEQRAHITPCAPNRAKPGRSRKLPQAFVLLAATQWLNAISDNNTKVSNDRLQQIASAMDAANYLPPARYLEGEYAQELKRFNSFNSNSKVGPIKTWSELVTRGDKDLLRGMRRLFSRCAKKVDDHPLSGN
jgi:hypothetical protein